jgi:hypothetical protein
MHSNPNVQKLFLQTHKQINIQNFIEGDMLHTIVVPTVV